MPFTEKQSLKPLQVSRQLWLRGWAHGKTVHGSEDFREAAAQAGMIENQIQNTVAIHNEPVVKDRLRQTTDEAAGLRALGVPTIVVQGLDGKTHAIWGSDRMGVIGFLIGEKYQGPLTELFPDFKAAIK